MGVERPAPGNLPVLVVDGASATCIPLTDHLRHRGLRCEIQGTSRGALEHLSRATAERWPRMLLVHFPPVDADGIEFLATVRQRFPGIPVICYADLNLVGGIIFDQAERMNVRFLALPFDLSRLDATLTSSLDDAQRRKSRDEQPFFGTSRHVRGQTSRYDNRVVPDRPAGTASTSSSERARTESTFPVAPLATPTPAPPTTGAQPPATTRVPRSGTSTLRRGVDTGLIPHANPGTERFSTHPIQSTTTNRIRRSVTGRVERPPIASTDAVSASGGHRRVICAACSQTFTVANRGDAFVVPCLQCGALNRIEPLSAS